MNNVQKQDLYDIIIYTPGPKTELMDMYKNAECISLFHLLFVKYGMLLPLRGVPTSVKRKMIPLGCDDVGVRSFGIH